MVDDKDGQRYMLLRDYTEYERNQSTSHWTVVSGLAGGLVLAFVPVSYTHLDVYKRQSCASIRGGWTRCSCRSAAAAWRRACRCT